MKPFDIFLSYRSTEGVEAEKLRDALEARGVRVWLDKDQIRPGDLFAKALGKGLATSRAVGMIVTPESVASSWVENKYYRALSLSTTGELQLIALLFGPAQLPDFLKDRSWINFKMVTTAGTWTSWYGQVLLGGRFYLSLSLPATDSLGAI